MELNIGSNVIRNSNGVLQVEGREQIELELGEDGQVLLTMDIYNAKGDHVARLRRNAWVFRNEPRYEITTNPDSLTLIDTETDKLVVEANVVSRHRINVLHGAFYTHRGHLLEITPDYWQIDGGLNMSNNVFDSVGGAVSIG